VDSLKEIEISKKERGLRVAPAQKEGRGQIAVITGGK